MTISTNKLIDSADINNKFTDINNKLNQKVSKTGNEDVNGVKDFKDTIKVKNLQITNSGTSKTPNSNSRSKDIATTEWVRTLLEPTFEKITPPTTNSGTYKNFCQFPNGLLIQWGYVNTPPDPNSISIQAINFPKAFSQNRSYSFVVTVSETAPAGNLTGTVHKTIKQYDSTGVEQNQSSIKIVTYRDQVPYFWIAIGY